VDALIEYRHKGVAVASIYRDIPGLQREPAMEQES
jgi:hypothetical protein